jgi:predicted DsbA family dithiol-disulfide isomerase
MGPHTVQLDVWSDYVCPFCYLVEPTLAQIQQDGKGKVRISWHAFELRPDPVPTLDPNGNYLRDVWERAVYPMAKARGMVLRLPPVQPRSRLAHEAAAFAREDGRFESMNHALFRAFFEHGEDIGQLPILEDLAASASLKRRKLSAALQSGQYREQVLNDEETAHRLGLSGVPASLIRAAGAPIERAILVEGAQPVDVCREAVARANRGTDMNSAG